MAKPNCNYKEYEENNIDGSGFVIIKKFNGSAIYGQSVIICPLLYAILNLWQEITYNTIVYNRSFFYNIIISNVFWTVTFLKLYEKTEMFIYVYWETYLNNTNTRIHYNAKQTSYNDI